jgi:DNA invertase Pin-like site-specific DNA recombinase
MHTFLYCRVSTGGQTTENQAVEAENAGFAIDQAYSDTISGKVPAAERPEFSKLLDTIGRTRKPKRLIVTKLDRLGRDAGDILSTVKRLEELDCGVKVLQLGDIDLTSPAGKIILATLSAVAEVERDLIVERTKAGLVRARRQGKKLGRPKALGAADETRALAALRDGESITSIARDLGVSRATIMRLRDARKDTAA